MASAQRRCRYKYNVLAPVDCGFSPSVKPPPHAVRKDGINALLCTPKGVRRQGADSYTQTATSALFLSVQTVLHSAAVVWGVPVFLELLLNFSPPTQPPPPRWWRQVILTGRPFLVPAGACFSLQRRSQATMAIYPFAGLLVPANLKQIANTVDFNFGC